MRFLSPWRENMKFLNKCTKTISDISICIGGMCMVIIAVCLFLQVILRLMHVTATWTSEFARYAFMIAVFYGMAAANDRGLNMVVTMFSDRLKPKTGYYYSIFTKLLIGIFFCVITYGVLVTANTSSKNNQSFESFTNIKICYLYYTILVGLFFSTLNTFLSVIKDLLSGYQIPSEEQKP